LDGFSDRLRISRIGLAALHVGLHVSWRHQLDGMAELRQLAPLVMRGRAGFHANQAGREFSEEG
jgi:hypothetical protein